ncbi:MAG: DUF4097 family beta strand repeat protein [Lachnospiraceae bacterium]|jgi:hypothetical protein|nr:DUF4097 family beta strand repeat protein [Lachnospiraceae bacterium]
MKKVIKWMVIFSVVFCVLGIGVIAAGAMMGGGHYMRQALRIADRWDRTFEDWEEKWDREREREWDAWENAGITVNEALLEAPGSMENPLEGSFFYENIRELEADVDGIVAFMEAEDLSPGQVMIVKGEDGEDYEYRQDGDTLKIHWPSRYGRGKEAFGKTITILVPVGACLDEIDIEVAAGTFQADVMRAKEISLGVKAGVIEVGRAETDSLELEVDAGQILCRADVAREVSADSDLGEILLELKGKKEDFDYELECSAGLIILKDDEEEEYQGLHHETTMDNGAGKKAELECSAGSITVTYWEESESPEV